MSSKLDPFALIKTAFRGRSPVDPSRVVATPAPASATAPPQSKGPPPLPKMAAPPTPGESIPVEELFFQEGIDGHAESVPPDGASPFPLGGTNPFVGADAESTRAARSTIPPTSLDDEWPALEEEVEDPARTRRRRAARIGTAWGTVVALVLVGVAAFVSPRRDGRAAAAAASPPPVETTAARPPAAAQSPVTPPSQSSPPQPAAATSPTPAVRAPVASVPPPASVPSCRAGMLPSATGHATCVDVTESLLCTRDPRTHALRPAGCIDAKSPKAACESRGARLVTSAERHPLAGAKGKTGAGAFRCAATR